MDREFSRWGLALVLLIGLVLRIGFVAFACHDVLFPPSAEVRHDVRTNLADNDDYGRLALNVVRHGTFGYPKDPNDPKSDMRATAYRPPLYPALLMPAAIPDLLRGVPLKRVELNPWVVLGIHVLLGVITIGLVYYIAYRMECRWCWLPSLAVAADPILLHYSTEMMTETMITLLAVWAWALYLMLVRPNLGEVGRKWLGMRMSLRISMVLGVVLGMAVLTRPTMLPWSILMIASLAFRGSDAGNRVSMITAALIAMSLINAAWMFRNKQTVGKPIWTTTHGGYTLLLANNPPLYKHFSEWGASRSWKADEFHKLWASRRDDKGKAHGDPTLPEFWETVPLGTIHVPDIKELEDDRLAQQAAIATIKANPVGFLTGCFYRTLWLWSPYPHLEPEPKDKLPEGTAATSESAPEPDIAQPAHSDSTADVQAQTSQEKETTEVAPKVTTAEANTQDSTRKSTQPVTSPELSLAARAKQWLIGAWYCAWFAMALVGFLWLREALTSRVWLMPVLLVLTLTGIHAIYWSNMRMRAPMMPVVYMLACWPLYYARTPSRLSN